MRRFDPGSLFYLGLTGVPSLFGVGPEWLELFMLFFLFGFWPFLAGIVAGDDRTLATRFFVSQVVYGLTPWGFAASIGQMAGQVVPRLRYRGDLPDADSHDPRAKYHLPFTGEWVVASGGVTREYSHSWSVVAQRYAYDFLRERDDSTHADGGRNCEDYYCFGKPVVAPAAGVVVRARDGLRDHPKPQSGWTEWRTWDIRGNHVVVNHGNGEYSLLAHLREGSVEVSSGDRVERGDRVAACGNSGNSTEPHLHFQVQDHPNFFLASGLPVTFADFERERDSDREHRESGHVREGDVVQPA